MRWLPALSLLLNRKMWIRVKLSSDIGFSTLCTVYPAEDIGIMILVNDTINQDNVSKLSNTIKNQLR
jgi:hypothetical protein